MSKGEQMLVDLGYEKAEEKHYSIRTFANGRTFVEFYEISKSTGVYLQSEEYGRLLIKMPVKLIQAIHQCCVDYGWIESE